MRVLCVHQGHELYGSDRSFLLCLDVLRKSFQDPDIVVLLPQQGPLQDVLTNKSFDARVADLWVPRKNDGMWGLLKKIIVFPLSVRTALAEASQSQLVYINTSVVFDHLIAARFSKTPTIVHVREIPTGIAAKVIRRLLKFSKATLVFNSEATRNSFNLPPTIKMHTVHNSIPDRYAETAQRKARDRDGMFNILMVGRINSWKGQDLLLEALTLLEPNLRTRIHVKILGDVYGNSEMLIELQALVSLQLSDAMITFEGFKSDTQPYYQWADAVIVPSKKPEPFGLVAIEAMSAARDVVVADHGGLSEIVEHQVSGIKVEPNNALALAHALEELLFGKTSYGEAARERFLSHFSQALLEERMRAIFKYSATAKRGATEDGGDALDEDS